jgi:hypothetical protein
MGLRIISAFAGVSLLVCTTQAADVYLGGDLGSNGWLGNNFSAINTFTTTPFTQTVPGLGTLTGDAFSNNGGGGSFSLRLTNLTFTMAVPGPTAGTAEIILIASHGYQTAGSGSYSSSHQLTGFWTTATGNQAELYTLLDQYGAAVTMPTLSGINTAATTFFNFGLSGVGVTSTSTTFVIQTRLRLILDGTGSIFLPSSAEVNVELVPAPGAASLVVVGGLVNARRRRR